MVDMTFTKSDRISRPFGALYLLSFGAWVYLAVVSEGVFRLLWLILAVAGAYPAFTMTKSAISQDPRTGAP
jgi:hypothetical protein